MHVTTIAESRRFSLAHVERSTMIDGPDLRIELVCFEAGQREVALDYPTTAIYQVLEGEALVRAGDEVVRLVKGKLLSVAAGTQHALENAGGGLLVVQATRPS